jgi:cytidylate kinase
MAAVTGPVFLDGHTASGKSTISKLLRDRIGGCIIKPFDDETAFRLLRYHAEGEFAKLDEEARAVLDAGPGAGAPTDEPIIFDRHWVSVAARLPDALQDGWKTLPRSFVCWADLETTLDRVVARGGSRADAVYQAEIIAAYRTLAERRHIRLIDTSKLSQNAAVDLIVSDLGL